MGSGNEYDTVHVSIPVAESPVYLIQLLDSVFQDHVYKLEVRMCHILNLWNRLYRYNHQGQHYHN